MKQNYFEQELNKIKDFLFENTDFDIGVIEHLKVDPY